MLIITSCYPTVLLLYRRAFERCVQIANPISEDLRQLVIRNRALLLSRLRSNHCRSYCHRSYHPCVTIILLIIRTERSGSGRRDEMLSSTTGQSLSSAGGARMTAPEGAPGLASKRRPLQEIHQWDEYSQTLISITRSYPNLLGCLT